MEDLSQAGAEIAGPGEGLRQGDDRRQEAPEVRLVVFDMMAVGPQAGQEAHPRGVADPLGAIGAPEDGPFGREPVDPRRTDRLDPVASELRAKVVDGDEENVGAAGSGNGQAGPGRPQARPAVAVPASRMKSLRFNRIDPCSPWFRASWYANPPPLSNSEAARSRTLPPGPRGRARRRKKSGFLPSNRKEELKCPAMEKDGFGAPPPSDCSWLRPRPPRGRPFRPAT